MAGALLIFALTYALTAARRVGLLGVARPAAAIAGAVACVLSGILLPEQAYASIDGDTLVLLIAMMLLAAHLDQAGFFEWRGWSPLNLPRPALCRCWRWPCGMKINITGRCGLPTTNRTHLAKKKCGFSSPWLVTLPWPAAYTHLYLSTEVARQRLSAILASPPGPVLVTNEQNQLLLANPAAWRVLGVGVEWDEGVPIERVISQPELLRLLRSQGEEKRSANVTLPDGRVYFSTASSILADGKRVGRVCVMRDITQLKQLDTLKSEFVATVSHDLRSPLTLIRGYASMLDMVGDLNEQQASYIEKIVSGVDNMAALVNNLLDLGRIEAGVDLQLEKVSAKQVVERAVKALQDQADQKRVALNIDIPEHSLPPIEADLALLQQAIQNLVDNAIKYTEPGGQVQVSVSTRQEQIVFQVRDTGIGIAPVDQGRLFEKFYRGAQSSSTSRCWRCRTRTSPSTCTRWRTT